MKQLFFLIITLGLSFSVFAQLQLEGQPDAIQPPAFETITTNQARNCGTTIYEDHLRSLDPNYDAKKESVFREAQKIGAQQRSGVVVTIPVVVHVVYNTSTENISLSQIQSQIAVLNKDFRRTNSDASQTPQVFQNIAADSEIEFCLASVDPNGAATNGVTRTQTNRTSFQVPYSTNDPEPLKFTAQGGKDAWNSTKYLNMWVADISNGVLGYATFPGTSTAARDGVVMGYKYFGTSGTAQSPYNGGRTATHEVGHYLGLRHIWGDGACFADDNITDTPTSGASYGGCPTHPQSSCSTTDMFMNYMDYVNDNCMNLFTQGQKAVMVGVLQSQRSSVIGNASTACGTINPSPCNDLASGPGVMGFEANENTSTWSIEDANGDGFTWRFSDKPTNHTEWGPRTGNKLAVYTWNDNNLNIGADDWLWSNCIAFQTNHQYEITFWYAAGSDGTGTYPEKLEVALSTGQNATAVVGTIESEFTISNAYPGFLEKKINFGITGGGDGYIGFHATSAANQYALQLDDLLIRDLSAVANEEIAEEEMFQLYPNPASDYLHLEVNSPDFLEEAEVRIYDMTGKLLLNKQLTAVQNEDITFNVSDFSNGIYIVNLVSGGKISTKKVVISK